MSDILSVQARSASRAEASEKESTRRLQGERLWDEQVLLRKTFCVPHQPPPVGLGTALSEMGRTLQIRSEAQAKLERTRAQVQCSNSTLGLVFFDYANTMSGHGRRWRSSCGQSTPTCGR